MDPNKKILLDLYPDYKYICGPYLRKDGRKQSSGLYGAQVQNGAPKLNRQKIHKEYYQLEK